MRTVGIQHLREIDYKDMTDQISYAIYQIVFVGLVEEVKKVDPSTAHQIQVFNAPLTILEKALHSGRVQYVDGIFSGEFGAAVAVEIRKLGGRWDKRMAVYYIDKSIVPTWVKAAATTFRAKAIALHDRIVDMLEKAQADIDRLVEKHAVDASKTVERVEEGFRGAAQAIGVNPTITKESKAQLAKEYSENMKLYIKDFSTNAIEKLREDVEANAMKGYRFDKLIDTIRQRYGVTRSKAAFLARQETSLFMAKYREMRFKEGGVRRYTWHTAQDERVRASHKHLNGRIFDYDHPPVVDPSTGRRGNPGQDFNCRCVDAPVLEAVREAA